MSDLNEYEPVPPSELTPASNVENTDKLLIQGADGLLKTATRAQVMAYVQTELDAEIQIRTNEDVDIRQTFTRFQVVSAVPDVENMLPRVLYLYNATGDVYQGYYLIEGTTPSRGQIGGRSYTGINGITVSFENATISNDLVTRGGTIGGDLVVNGEVTINYDATITGKVTVSGGADITGDVNITGDVTTEGATTLGGNTQIDGDLTIDGNIYQRGSAYETHAEKIYTKNDMIITRDGAESPLGADELTGFKAKHYDVDGNDGILAFDRNGTARVGDYTKDKVFTVYSSDGVTFYSDSEMTEEVTIPSGVTPELVEGNEYTYTQDVNDTEPILTRSEESDLNHNDILMWNSTQKKAVNVPRPSLNNTILTAKIQNNQTTYEWESGGSAGVAFKGTRSAYNTAKLIPEGSDGHIPSGALVIITDEGKTYITNGTGSGQTLELVANATFNGTHAEWNALTSAQKAMYNVVNFTDDEAIGLTISDVVQDGNMNPVTSNAVYDAINDKTGGGEFRNVVIPGNYLEIDQSSNWTTTKANKLFSDLVSILEISPSDRTSYVGQFKITNGLSYIGSYIISRYGNGYMSVNMHSYDAYQNYRLIMSNGGNPIITRINETQL